MYFITASTLEQQQVLAIKENCKSTLKSSSNKMKQNSVIGFVSFAAVVHSHIYWVYSIIYIAYHKMTPIDETSNIRWKSGKFQKVFAVDTNTKQKKKVSRHDRKKLLTNKLKSVIMPTIAPTTKGTVVIDVSPPPQQKVRVPLLQAFRTFPSSGATNQEFNIHQLIKSQRKLPKRSSTGQLLNKKATLPALVEVENHTRSSEDSFSSGHSSIERINSSTSSKTRDRAMGLLRSTFHRSYSTPGVLIIKSSSSYSSISDSEEVAIVPQKKRRDTLFSKFSSSKKVVAVDQAVPLLEQKESPASLIEEIKKQQRTKLFRSLLSWKKGEK